MFITRPEGELFSILEDCLRHGIADQPDANYASEGKKVVLIVNPFYRYVELYSHGTPLFKMEYQPNNIGWEEATIEHPDREAIINHFVIVSDMYEDIRKEKRLYVKKVV